MTPVEYTAFTLPSDNSSQLPDPLKALYENMPVYLCVVDSDLRYTYVSRHIARANGLSIEAHVGRRLDEIVPRAASVLVPKIQQVLETGDPVINHEVEGEALSGRPSSQQWAIDYYPLFNQDQTVNAVSVMTRELTELRQLEAARREGREQLQFFAETSTLFANATDFEATLQQVAELVVPRYADWCSVDVFDSDNVLTVAAFAHANTARAEMVRQLHTRYVALPEGQAQYQAFAQQPYLSGEFSAASLDEFAPTPAQRELVEALSPHSIIAVPLQARGETLGVLSLVWEQERLYGEHDVSFVQEVAQRAAVAIDNARLFREARAAEQKLRALNESLEQRVAQRTAALERSNRELEEFAYVASHDLQEPMRKITAFGDRVQQRLQTRNDATALDSTALDSTTLDSTALDSTTLDYIERMQNAARRMSTLITDLLALSRISTHSQPFDEVSLYAVVQGVLQDLEVGIAERGAQITVEPLPAIEADPVQMRQLFQNLIANALRFRQADVPPTVSIYCEETIIKDGHVLHHLCVADNGIGFDEKYLDRIFHPFQRLHGHGEYRGTGMGLAICRKVVERHGGTITARSQPGDGATFVIVLPRSQRFV